MMTKIIRFHLFLSFVLDELPRRFIEQFLKHKQFALFEEKITYHKI